MTYKKGNLVLIQQGEYSDKCTVGLFKVLKDFTDKESLEHYFRDNTEAPDWSDDIDKFPPFLIKAGYLEEVNFDVFHIGCYGTLEVSCGTTQVYNKEKYQSDMK